MGFLGKVIKGGSRFLGKAVTGAQFLVRVAPQIQQGARYASALANNGAVQAAGQKVGIPRTPSAAWGEASALLATRPVGCRVWPGTPPPSGPPPRAPSERSQTCIEALVGE